MMENEGAKKSKAKLILIVAVLIVLVALIAYFQLWRMYSEEQSLQEDLTLMIDEIWPYAQVEIPPPPADQGERLAAAQAKLEEAQQREFPVQMSNTEIMETLFQWATDRDVVLYLQSSHSSGSEDGMYDTLRFGVSASGALGDVLSFILKLEGTETDTPAEGAESDAIDTVQIDRVSLSGAGESWIASFTMTIHTQLPAPLPQVGDLVEDVVEDVEEDVSVEPGGELTVEDEPIDEAEVVEPQDEEPEEPEEIWDEEQVEPEEPADVPVDVEE